MSSETGGSTSTGGPVSRVSNAVTVRNLSLLFAGVLGGAGVSVLDSGAVAVPVVGAVPGTLLGVVGIAAAVAVYQQKGCGSGCDDGDGECGCGDGCS